MAGTDNIIDTLAIAIKLDPSHYKEGQEQVVQSLGQTKAEGKRTAESLEASGKQGAEFFDQLADRALRLSAVLAGGVGVKDLLANAVKSGAAMGYMANNIGMTARELGVIRNEVRQMGGDADEVAPALLGLSQALAKISLHGEGSQDLIEAFGFIGVTGSDLIDNATGKVKDLSEVLPKVAKGLRAVSERFGQPTAFALGSQLGLTPAMINLYTQAAGKLEAYRKVAEEITQDNDKQAESYQKLTRAAGTFWGNIEGGAKNTADIAVTAFHKMGEAIDAVAARFDKLPASVKSGMGSVARFLLEPFGLAPKTAADKDRLALSAGITAGAAAGGLTGTLGGPLAPITVPIGILGGGILGGIIAYAGKKTDNQLNPSGPAAPPGPERLTSPNRQPAGMSAPIEWTTDAMRRLLEGRARADLPTAEAQRAAATFNIIRSLEGGKEGSATPTRDAKDPFAYGLNQITLETAKKIDLAATPEKLMTAEYNNAMARALQARYLAKYNGDLDAVAIAYHNGEGAADRYVASGGDTSKTGNWGPQSQKYLDDARAAAAGPTNNTASTTIGSISVNAPRATDAEGIIAGMRERLEQDQLISHAQAGNQ